MIVNNVNWPSDEVLERFVAVSNSTCLIALDHALASIMARDCYRRKAEYMAFLSDKINRAEKEVKKCL